LAGAETERIKGSNPNVYDDDDDDDDDNDDDDTVLQHVNNICETEILFPRKERFCVHFMFHNNYFSVMMTFSRSKHVALVCT
jgi:hypothetical protein